MMMQISKNFISTTHSNGMNTSALSYGMYLLMWQSNKDMSQGNRWQVDVCWNQKRHALTNRGRVVSAGTPRAMLIKQWMEPKQTNPQDDPFSFIFLLMILASNMLAETMQSTYNKSSNYIMKSQLIGGDKISWPHTGLGLQHQTGPPVHTEERAKSNKTV